MSNVVRELAEEPEDDFYCKPWQRARQSPLSALAGDLPVAEFALRFIMSHADVDVALTGTMGPNHLETSIRWAETGGLPEGTMHRARAIHDDLFGSGYYPDDADGLAGDADERR